MVKLNKNFYKFIKKTVLITTWTLLLIYKKKTKKLLYKRICKLFKLSKNNNKKINL